MPRRGRRFVLAISLREILDHPLRTLLIAQGMLWAVVLAVVPAAVLDGSRRQALERADDLGTNRAQITGETRFGLGAPEESDLPVLRRELGPEVIVSGLRVERVYLPGGRRLWALGCDSDLPAARGVEILEGRFPRGPQPSAGGDAGPPEVEIALEATLAEQLRGEGSLLELRLAVATGARLTQIEPLAPGRRAPEGTDRIWRVVGVVEDEASRGTDRFGYEKGRPFELEMNRLLRILGVAPARIPYLEGGEGIYVPRGALPGERIDWIFLSADPLEISALADRAEALLVERDRRPLIYLNTVWSVLSGPELESYLHLHTIFFWLSVVLGMAVVSNLLLLTGWQRRREIALRRAEGATRGDIFLQFVGEAVGIALVGAGLGLLVGMAIAKLRIELDPNVALAIEWPWAEALRSTLILTVASIVAAAYPAWKASRHHPMTLFRRGGAL